MGFTNVNYASFGFCSSQASMAIAAAVLRDMQINYSTYSGFPEVVPGYGEGSFSVWLRVGGAEVGPLVVSPEVLRKEIGMFEAGKPAGKGFFRSVQDLLGELEAAAAQVAKEAEGD